MTNMNVGMMWFDGDKRNSLVAKIDRAANYYQEKYGRHPTVCFVNPSTAGKESPTMEDLGLKLQTSVSVLPDHFWLGIGQETD